MVLRTLITLLTISSLSFGADYQLANKASAGYQLFTESLETSLWTNSLLWVIAESPITIAGTTNTYINYAKLLTNDAVVVGNAAPSRTNINEIQQYVFDGADDAISWGNNTNFNFLSSGQSFTIETWAKTDQTNSNFQAICAKRDISGTSTNGYSIVFGRGSIPNVVQLQIYTNGVGVPLRTYPSTNYVNRWVYIVCTWNGSTPALYVNGVSDSGGGGGNTALANNDSFQIGSGAAYNTLQGRISNFKIYQNYVMPVGLVSSNFNATRSKYGI